MDTIDHPLTSMHAARQYEEESSRNRSSSSSPLPLPSNRSRNNSNSSLSSSASSTAASPPSLAETLDSSIASASSSPPLSETPTRSPATAAANGATLESVGSDLSQLSVPLARISTSDRRWLEDFINKDDDEDDGEGMGEDLVNPCLRSQQYSALGGALNSSNSLHYISDTDDDDDDDDDAEDSPAIIVHDISRQDHSAKHQGHRELHRKLSLEKEQEVARMTAQLSTQCDLYERKISSAPPSGTSASTSIRPSVVPRPRSRQSSSNGSPDIQTMTNTVRIHVYDLLAKDAEMELFSWGCHVPIGRCFVAMNDGLHALGSGAYHVGVEVNGLEFAYGANDAPSLTGVFTCRPRCSPGYQYRTTLDFGSCSIGAPGRSQGSRASPPNDTPGNSTASDGHRIMQDMAREYLGCDYDLLRRNCCTFARDACLRLGVAEDEIPSWFLHLASAGADAHDAVTNVEAAVDRGVEPLKRILSLENSASIGRRRRERPERSARKDSDKEERENTSGCGKMRDGSAIDSVVDAIGRSLCFGPQMLTDSCAT